MWDEPVECVLRSQLRLNDSSLTEDNERAGTPEPIPRRFSEVVVSLGLRSSIWERMPRMYRRSSEVTLRPGLRGSMWTSTEMIEEGSNAPVGPGLRASL